MSWRHRDILEAELHEPKGFTTANNGDSIWRNENGASEWTDREVLPAALNFVDASVAPPTTASGDIYVLSLGASIHANWGTVALKDWVRYDGVSWNVITPSKSILCYDKTEDVLMSYDGSVWATVGSDTNLATTNLTQTDLNRVYTRSPIAGISRLRLQGTSSKLVLEDSRDIDMFSNKYDDAGAIPGITLGAGGGGTGSIGFSNNRSLVKGVSNQLQLYGYFGTSIQSKIILSADILITPNTNRSIKLQTDNIFFQNSTGATTYGHIDDDEFYWGATTPIGSEKFSIQVDTLIKGSDTSASTSGFKVTDVNNLSLLEVKNNGQINMGSLPTSSVGLSSGDIWNNSGVLNIV